MIPFDHIERCKLQDAVDRVGDDFVYYDANAKRMDSPDFGLPRRLVREIVDEVLHAVEQILTERERVAERAREAAASFQASTGPNAGVPFEP